MMKKFAVILYPVSNKVWARVPADEFERNSEVSDESVVELLPGEVWNVKVFLVGLYTLDCEVTLCLLWLLFLFLFAAPIGGNVLSQMGSS